MPEITPSPAPGKRGRKPNHYRRKDNTYVEGLARKADGRWRIIGTDITYREDDEDRAIHRFHLWRARQKGEQVLLPVGTAPNAHAAQPLISRAARPTRLSVTIPWDYSQPTTVERGVPSDEFFAEMRRVLLADPRLCAERTGLPALARWPEWASLPPSPKLSELGESYARKPNVSEKELKRVRRMWNEFADAIGTTVEDITPAKVSEWGDEVLRAGGAAKYIKHRFNAVRTVLRYTLKRGTSPDEIRRALDATAVLEAPRGTILDPRPICREAFHKLLDAADEQGKALLLLALNACMYGSEVSDLKWSDLDLDKGSLSMSRGKTGVARVAVLWGRTVDALKKLPRGDGQTLFISDRGPFNGNVTTKWFSGLREKAKVGDNVQFSHIRDGSYSAAAEGEGVTFDMVRSLAGHRAGVSDHYLRRHPKLVAPACAAIERAYFAGGALQAAA